MPGDSTRVVADRPAPVARAARVRRRNALLLWFAQLISITGDALFLPCVGWLAAEASGQEIGVGAAMAFAALPFLLFGPWVGAWIDRTDRRRVMVLSDMARAILLIVFVAALWGGLSLHLAGLLVLAFCMGTCSTPFVPARDALLPELVGGRSLARWNATFQTSSTVAMLAGLLLGGLLLAVQDGDRPATDRLLTVLLFDAGTFVLSVLCLRALVLKARVPREGAAPGLREDAKAGMRLVRSDRILLGLLALTAVNNLALMGPALVGPVLLLRDDMGLGPEHLVWFEGAMAGGMLVGGLLLARLGDRLPMPTTLLGGMVLDGITYLPFVWIESYPLAVVVIALHGLFIPPIIVARTTLVQSYVPDAQRGKVFAFVSLTVTGMTALSCLGAGALAAWLGVRSLFAVTGVLATAAGIVGFWRLAPALRQVGQPEPVT